jgi:hypothetical protein
MGNDLHHCEEKLYLAVAEMAKSPKSLQERLADAFTYHLRLLEPEQFPFPLNSRFEHIFSEVTKVNASGKEGRFIASTRAMSDDDAAALIGKVVDLWNDVSEVFYQET